MSEIARKEVMQASRSCWRLSSGRAGGPQTWVRTDKLLFKKLVISVASVVESALGLVRPALEVRNHPLRVEISVAEVHLEIVPVRVARVLTAYPTM